MDATCWKVVGGMGTAILALAGTLAVVTRVLFAKLEEARKEVVAVHTQRARELEELNEMLKKRTQQ
jgi:hypothetical protein